MCQRGPWNQVITIYDENIRYAFFFCIQKGICKVMNYSINLLLTKIAFLVDPEMLLYVISIV